MEDITRKLQFNSLFLSDDKIDFRGIVYTLLAEKKLILVITLIFFSLGVFNAITKIPSYQAKLLMQVEKKQSGAEMEMASFAGLNKTTSVADTQMTLIKSHYILVPTIENLGLDLVIQPHYFPYFGRWYAHSHHTLTKPFLGMSEYAWGGERLVISRFIIQPQEGLFKLVAGKNQTYSLFSDDHKLILIGKVGKLEKITSDKVKGVILIKNLEANPGAEFSLSKTSAESMADDLSSQLQISDLGQSFQYEKTGVLQMTLTGSKPQYLVDVLNAIANTAIQKDTERKSIEAGKALTFLEGQLPVIKKSLASSENALNSHRMKSGTIDVSVKLKMILKQLTDVQREIEKVSLTRIMLLQKFTPQHPYILGLKDKKIALQEELASLENKLQHVPASDQVTVSLIRDIKIKNHLYSMLLSKIQELQFIKAGTLSDVRILHPAHLPHTALPLHRFITMLTYILMGLILGCLLVMLKKAFKRVVDNPNWMEQRFGIPNFAIIPYSKKQKTNLQAFQDQTQNLLLLAESQPHDLSIESLRSLRTSLQLALIGAKNNLISIMGISPGIGKSFISVNLAYVLANAGKRILLIDGDIRKGYLHNYFRKNRTPGLSEALNGVMSLDQAIQKTHIANIDFIASGKFPPNPSELLMRNQLKEILDAVSLQYDLVIIDTAPILAVTDGVLIANHTAVNLLVIANSTHQAEEIDLAMKRLQSNHITVQGTIFNNTKATQASQGRYNYTYQYGEAETEK